MNKETTSPTTTTTTTTTSSSTTDSIINIIICPICLDEVPYWKRNRRVLECCNNVFCKSCLNGGKNGNKNDDKYVIDWCPLCRAFVPAVDSNSTTTSRDAAKNIEKQYRQAKRLIFSSQTTTAGGGRNIRNINNSNSRSFQQGMTILEDLIHNNNDNNNNNTTLLKIKFTLANALSQSGQQHYRRSVQLLHGIVDQSSTRNGRERDNSNTISKMVGTFGTRESKRVKARAHFLLAELLRNEKERKENNDRSRSRSTNGDDSGVEDDVDDDDGNEESEEQQLQEDRKGDHQDDEEEDDDDDDDNLTIQYHYDQAVLLNGKQNLSLLLQCAKSSISLDSKFQHYKQILQINKYHIDANLWFAHYYQQYLMEMENGANDNSDQRQQNRPQRGNANANPSTTLLYISYIACIVRAQFAIQKYTTHRQQQSAQTQSSNEYYSLKQQQCQQHQRYILQKQSPSSSSSSSSTVNDSVNSTATSKFNVMNHISAAYIDVIQLQR
jgi:hypothetical protein